MAVGFGPEFIMEGRVHTNCVPAPDFLSLSSSSVFLEAEVASIEPEEGHSFSFTQHLSVELPPDSWSSQWPNLLWLQSPGKGFHSSNNAHFIFLCAKGSQSQSLNFLSPCSSGCCQWGSGLLWGESERVSRCETSHSPHPASSSNSSSSSTPAGVTLLSMLLHE